MSPVFFNARSRPPGGSRSVTCFCSTTSGSHKIPMKALASASSGMRSISRAVSTFDGNSIGNVREIVHQIVQHFEILAVISDEPAVVELRPRKEESDRVLI